MKRFPFSTFTNILSTNTVFAFAFVRLRPYDADCDEVEARRKEDELRNIRIRSSTEYYTRKRRRKMSSMLARKVHITATPDGALVLPALNGKGKAWVQTSGAKVGYQTGEVSTVLATEKDKDHTYEDGTDFWGIAGRREPE